jgi:cobalt/nickel transport protein
VNRPSNRIFIGLLVLVLLSPLGIIIPAKFHAGDAWGEWSIESIKKDLGFVPKGMEKNAKIWKAPLSNYGQIKGRNTILMNSGYYMVSTLVGMTLIVLITIVLLKIVQKREMRKANALENNKKSP